MKVLVVGDWLADIYEEAFYMGFQEHGCETTKFSWIQYFKYYQYPDKFDVNPSLIKSFYYKVQNRFTIGPVISQINRDLVASVRKNQYDLVFIYRGTHILPSTLQRIRESGSIIFGYNNDDPFSDAYPKYFWRHFRNGLKLYDCVFSYREKNIRDYESVGIKDTEILRSYFLKDKNIHIPRANLDREFLSDVVFVGHYESDGRDRTVLSLLSGGVGLKIYGTDWQRSPLYEEIIRYTGVIQPAYKHYNEVLNGAKVALVFLSKKNNDTYTRRVFEIPAVKTMMLSEYTDDMATLYEDKEEIFFFHDDEQCLLILKELLADPIKIQSVADQAYSRLISDDHEVYGRVSQVLAKYESLSKGCKAIKTVKKA